MNNKNTYISMKVTKMYLFVAFQLFLIKWGGLTISRSDNIKE